MKNVFLTGFMGTGKTTTGRILAKALGATFTDLDRAIEEEVKKTIPEIFASHGESYFRTLEGEVLKKVAARRPRVIATGGGTVTNPANIATLKENGTLVCLTATVEAIMERTKERGVRPLLDASESREDTIRRLLAARKDAYSAADFVVDTSDLSPLEAADEILRFLRRG